MCPTLSPRKHTSSPMLAQNALLTYRLLPSLITSLPTCLSMLPRCAYPASPLASLPGLFRPLSDLCNWSAIVAIARGLCTTPFWVTVPSSSTCAPRLCTTPSSRLRRASSSVSGGFLLLRGARPGPGNMHSMCAFVQLPQEGWTLSQRTFRLRQVTQERMLSVLC
jgi:hypothetical protein